MTREEAENLLDEYLDKYETMTDYIMREDYTVWTQVAEDKAMLEYMQLRDKLIELICGQVESAGKVTREEAVKNLSEMRDGMPSDKCQDWIDAISMAVRSLKAWDSVIDKLRQFQEPEDPTLVVTMRIDHFINIINENLKEVEDDKRRSS